MFLCVFFYLPIYHGDLTISVSEEIPHLFQKSIQNMIVWVYPDSFNWSSIKRHPAGPQYFALTILQ